MERLIVLSMFRPANAGAGAEPVPILGGPGAWGAGSSWHTG